MSTTPTLAVAFVTDAEFAALTPQPDVLYVFTKWHRHRITHDGVTVWLDPGWYRRTWRNGEPRYTELTRWRLVRHRVLWGFTRGLVDAR